MLTTIVVVVLVLFALNMKDKVADWGFNQVRSDAETGRFVRNLGVLIVGGVILAAIVHFGGNEPGQTTTPASRSPVVVERPPTDSNGLGAAGASNASATQDRMEVLNSCVNFTADTPHSIINNCGIDIHAEWGVYDRASDSGTMSYAADLRVGARTEPLPDKSHMYALGCPTTSTPGHPLGYRLTYKNNTSATVVNWTHVDSLVCLSRSPIVVERRPTDSDGLGQVPQTQARLAQPSEERHAPPSSSGLEVFAPPSSSGLEVFANIEVGNGQSMLAGARMYESGKGLPKDINEAIEWYRRAAATSDPEASKQARESLQRLAASSDPEASKRARESLEKLRGPLQ